MIELFPNVITDPLFIQSINENKNLDFGTDEEVKVKLNPQYYYDFKDQKFIRDEKNKFIKIDKFSSIQKWIEKIVLTSRGIWQIYEGTEYGSDFHTIMTSGFEDDFRVMLLNKECKRVFTLHPEIVRVENIKIYQENTSCILSYTIILVDEDSFQGQLQLT